MIYGNTGAEHNEIQVVCFKLSGKEFGFPILQVKEVVKLDRMIELPELSGSFEGVINLRGQLVPIVDFRKRFGHPGDATAVPKALILKLSKEEYYAAVIDDISEIISLSESKFLALSPTVMENNSRNISGIVEVEEGRTIIMLDATGVLRDCDLENMKKTIEAATPGDGAAGS